MLTCGLKLTHDAAVAVIEHGGGHARLLFSVEVEKLGNRPRHAPIDDLAMVVAVLEREGLAVDDVDQVVIDGWGNGPDEGMASFPSGDSVLLAGYHESRAGDDVFAPLEGTGLRFPTGTRTYLSYRHVAHHIAATYCTSPFAAEGTSAYVLVWDGPILPRLYFFDAEQHSARFLRPLFPVVGHMYGTVAAHLHPFVPPGGISFEALSRDIGESSQLGAELAPLLRHNLTVPGKVMAYAALGVVRDDVLAFIRSRYRAMPSPHLEHIVAFAQELATLVETAEDVSSADVFASLQAFLGELLVSGLTGATRGGRGLSRHLCLAGGCALNIKWNAVIRDSGLFDRVWVPPFPNDSGAALGTACAHALATSTAPALEWDVYSGPRLQDCRPPGGWEASACTAEALGALLAEHGGPVVVLHGRAELGPRALGNRSILAAAGDARMKDVLNDIKQREPYRPVSPICLEDFAGEVFQPGGADPYMLFEHRVRPAWRERIPAVVHVDGSARLQTISPAQSQVLAAVLGSYRDRTGVPVLCNTSANLPGRGFFPDVASAMSWGGCDLVWSEGTLYRRRTTPIVRVATLEAAASQPQAG